MGLSFFAAVSLSEACLAQSEAPPPSPEPMPVPVAAPQARQPLQGGIEQNALNGGAHGTGLSGGIQGNGLSGGVEGGGWAGQAQQGAMGQGGAPLQGSAGQGGFSLGAANDPDAADQELQIQWDFWRNRLMQAIQNGTLTKINVQNDINFVWDQRQQMMVSRYASGASTWYAIDVLPDRRIVNIKLTQRSPFQSYDQAVLQAINDLQGNEILRYPAGSKRKIVSQESRVQTGAGSGSQYFQFGDVERQRQ